MRERILALLIAIPAFASPTVAEADRIVATIKPLHSLVAAVLGDTAQATLLIAGNASPHDFHLKPSQVNALQNAELIFYIDERLETFLPSVFETLPKTVRTQAVTKAPGLTLLARRKSSAWDDHAHNGDAHGLRHEAHDEHRDKHRDEHRHDEHHGNDDMHVWLDPQNAVRILAFIAEKLGDTYPENRDAYRSNARETIERVRRFDERTGHALAKTRNKPFIVFHDAYQYFERRYHLTNVGAITLEGRSPSPGHLREIRERLRATGVLCVFREPQFPDRLINTVIEGTDVRVGTLDPLGTRLPPGKDLYLRLMEELAATLEQCLDRQADR